MCDKHAFAFDVDRAYGDQLIDAIENSPRHSLEKPEAPKAIGVYALYRGDDPLPVYVGKVDSVAGVNGRLADHKRKIKNRQNIDLSEVTCRYLTMAQKWEVARAEDVLIKYYNSPWNKITGFGMHVPGAGRPGRPGYANQWNILFPPKRSS